MEKYRLYESERMEYERKEMRLAMMGANSSPEALTQLLNIIKKEPIKIVDKPVNNYEMEYLEQPRVPNPAKFFRKI